MVGSPCAKDAIHRPRSLIPPRHRHQPIEASRGAGDGARVIRQIHLFAKIAIGHTFDHGGEIRRKPTGLGDVHDRQGLAQSAGSADQRRHAHLKDRSVERQIDRRAPARLFARRAPRMAAINAEKSRAAPAPPAPACCDRSRANPILAARMRPCGPHRQRGGGRVLQRPAGGQAHTRAALKRRRPAAQLANFQQPFRRHRGQIRLAVSALASPKGRTAARISAADIAPATASATRLSVRTSSRIAPSAAAVPLRPLGHNASSDGLYKFGQS